MSGKTFGEYMHKAKRLLTLSYLAFLCLGTIAPTANAGSLYMPVHLSPEIESRVERLFIIANMPIVKRPIPIKLVQAALDKAEGKAPLLASDIRRYLDRYALKAAVTHASVSASYADNNTHYQEPNSRGVDHTASYTASIAGYAVLSDFVALNIGGVIREPGDAQNSNEQDEFPDGSFISIGWDYLQADIGYRGHWWGPFQESDMLLSTNASSMPGVTLSNVRPLPFAGFNYELFYAEMSTSDTILSSNRERRLSGNPRLLGIHMSFNPVDGFAIGFNRLLQHGGADRPDSPTNLYNALFNTKETDNSGYGGNDFGNQQSSVTTRYTFAGYFPVAIYMEYAGEDTSASSDAHLGNSALMFGIHMPRLTRNLDLTIETAEWQNAWYTNSNYGDGMQNYGAITGHWGGGMRNDGDAIGATAHTVKLIWDIKRGRSLTAKYHQITNQEIITDNYTSSKVITLEYAQGMGNLIAGAKIIAGNTVFDESFSRISGFIRW